MSDFIPSTPLPLQIRKIIYDQFNDPDLRFTNDQIFEIIKKNGDVKQSWTIDDMEKYFQEICDSGLVRNIAQNFTTIWFKLFDKIEKLHCKSCNNEIYMGKSEARICPNSKCKASI